MEDNHSDDSWLLSHKLPFGAPIDEVCIEGLLHPRLKELFIYGTTSLADDTSIIGRHHAVLSALRGGSRGQGALSTRLALKNAMETGQVFTPFLKATGYSFSCSSDKETSTPPGAALWLLRVFFGRLPVPLLAGNRWRQLGRQCSIASRRTCVSSTSCSTFGALSNAHLINAAVRCLQESSHAERTVLKAILELMAKVGGGGPALLSLVDFFAPSLVGASNVRLTDEATQHTRALLLFLCCHWSEIFSIVDDDGSFRDIRSARLIQSFPRSTTEFGEQPTPLERQSVSRTDARQKGAPKLRRLLQVGERNQSSKSAATPLLEKYHENCNYSKPDVANKASDERREDCGQALCGSESRRWLKSLFGNRGRSSMSSIPSASAIKYEPIAGGKHTWTL